MVKFFSILIVFVSMISLVEMQRIRKDSETLSNSGYSAVSRGRRESERYRGESLSSDNPNVIGHRNTPVTPANREVNQFSDQCFDLHCCSIKKTKIYRLPQYSNSVSISGSLPHENKSLLLNSGMTD